MLLFVPRAWLCPCALRFALYVIAAYLFYEKRFLRLGWRVCFLSGHKLGPFFPSFLRFPTFKCWFSYMLGLPYVVPSLVLNQVLPWFKGIVVLPVSHCACWGWWSVVCPAIGWFLVCLKCILLGLSLLTFILLSFLFAFLGPCPWEVFCLAVLQLAHVVSLQHHAVLLVASSWTRPLALCRDFYSLILSYSGIDVSWSLAVCPFFFFLSYQLQAWLSENYVSSVWLADLCLAIWCLLGLPLWPL